MNRRCFLSQSGRDSCPEMITLLGRLGTMKTHIPARSAPHGHRSTTFCSDCRRSGHWCRLCRLSWEYRCCIRTLSAAEGVDRQTEPVPEIEEIRTAVYQKAKELGRVTRKEVEEEFGFGSTKAFKVLKALCDAGLLIQQKYGNRTVYVPVK